MINKRFSFTRNNIQCEGTGDFFNDTDLSVINQYYFDWKKLNSINQTYDFRRNTLSEILSEGLASALFGWARTNATTLTGCPSSSCDLVDCESGELIQLKSCSTSGDIKPGPTSFGPESEFDRLIFMHLDCDKDQAFFYELDANDYKNWFVNKTQTIADQQAQGKRPRLTILPKVKANNIQPFQIYNFRKEDE